MKKFFGKFSKKIVLALMLIFALTFSACTYADGPTESSDGVSYIGNIDGFKATYRPQSYPVQDYYSNFSKDIIIELTKIFGQADFEVDLQTEHNAIYGGMNSGDEGYMSYDTYVNSYKIYFLDDIRSSVYLYNQQFNTYNARVSESYNWKWTIGPNNDFDFNQGSPNAYKTYFNGTPDTVENPNVVFNTVNDTAIKLERERFYFGISSEEGYYVGKYAESLQVAILEILLGRTPTEFTYNFATGVISPSASALLPSLQAEYSKYATYIGIAKDTDIPKITNYILYKVIGSQKFNETDTNNYFSRTDYQDIIEQMIWNGVLENYDFSDNNGQNASLGSLYDIFPTNVIKDYEANSFFISSKDGQNFAHIPSGEYQSLVMMPTKDNYLYEMWYFLVSSKVLSVDVSYRYYDSATGNFYQSAPVTVQTQVESNFNESRAQILNVNFYDEENEETLFLTKSFNQNIGNGILKASSSKYMDFQTKQYYKALPSVNGFGSVSVLDETAFISDGSSFFELVFDVHKDPAKPLEDYSFKVGMYSLFFASQSQINEYLLEKAN